MILTNEESYRITNVTAPDIIPAYAREAIHRDNISSVGTTVNKYDAPLTQSPTLEFSSAAGVRRNFEK